MKTLTNHGYKRDHQYNGTIELVVNDKVIYSQVYPELKRRQELFTRYTAYLRNKEGYIKIIPNWSNGRIHLNG